MFAFSQVSVKIRKVEENTQKLDNITNRSVFHKAARAQMLNTNAPNFNYNLTSAILSSVELLPVNSKFQDSQLSECKVRKITKKFPC